MSAQRAIIADITDLVHSLDGTVEFDRRPLTSESKFPVPHVTATVNGKVFHVARPTFRQVRVELVDWLKGVA